MSDYQNKCGSCMNFEFWVQKGKLRKTGNCICENRKDYHQASQKACMLYIENKGGYEENGMD